MAVGTAVERLHRAGQRRLSALELLTRSLNCVGAAPSQCVRRALLWGGGVTPAQFQLRGGGSPAIELFSNVPWSGCPVVDQLRWRGCLAKYSTLEPVHGS